MRAEWDEQANLLAQDAAAQRTEHAQQLQQVLAEQAVMLDAAAQVQAQQVQLAAGAYVTRCATCCLELLTSLRMLPRCNVY